MNIFRILSVLVAVVGLMSAPSFGEDTEAPVVTDKSETTYELIQKKYSYTDEQMKVLKESGLNVTEAGKAAHLASTSEKSIDEVVKMRTEQKMGWGEIAKSIGVHPREIGKGTAELRHEKKMEAHQKRMAKKAEMKAGKKEKVGKGH